MHEQKGSPTPSVDYSRPVLSWNFEFFLARRILSSKMTGRLVIIFICICGVLCQSRRQRLCEQGSCYPATGDLLIGREANLRASSTCGLSYPERYCIVSHLEEVTKCFTCDSSQPYVEGFSEKSHRVENIVSSFKDRKRRWWQASNGVTNVSIQLDLEAEFHFTHLIMTFKTFRPAAMLVERSYDFGKSWKVYRYFAADCAKSFPGIPTGPVRRLTDVICVSKYSDVVPATAGEVIFRVLPRNINIRDPYSEEVQNLLKLTNLRINFTELHTLGDNLLDSRPEIKEKYYYAMYDMTVRGSCSCYGHASNCLSDREGRPGDMVHGKCECMHNTKGYNCEMCADFYNDQPWRPARKRRTNACKPCNCNGHSNKCHFDAAVYESTGRVSGGVCDDCQHNTLGRNCQDCKSFFYQDPNRNIRDPYICQPCDCDPSGSLRNGECENTADPSRGVTAGQCICKRYVQGRRCDTCVDGYWNLKAENPGGCEPCSCSNVGTVGNYGCDKFNGLCRCKRFVTGRNCDECYPGYYGLSADPQGCRPCNCDIGGSLSEECDQTTGQCRCRPNIVGLNCNQPAQGYFVPSLDFNIYEAEFATGIGNTRVIVREPLPDRPQTWTGPGFMRVMEGDSLEFVIDDIRLPMLYDLIIRYEPQMPERWDDVRVTIVRPGRVDENGPCANSIPQDDLKATSLQPGNRYVVVPPASCLERGVAYTIRIDFTKYRSGQSTPEASILVDSIALVPNVDSIPIFQGPGEPERLKNEFIRFRCRESQLGVIQPDLAAVCKGLIFSISAVIHSRGLACECDMTGSLSAECNNLGGQCQCKPNVIGRRCDRCAPGTYAFGPGGCTACNCDAVGARDNNCDENTGQCVCIPNAYGRTCGECKPGYWNFPQCRRCECNGNADICENQSGRCIDCRDYTAGDFCDRCVADYYGDPRLSVRIPCRPCMCPGGPGSGFQHSDGCSLDPRTQDVICNCKPGFVGRKCDQCLDNFFGNPLVQNGRCEACVCNNNIDINTPGSCDSSSGECLICLFNTEGFNCERCRPGYFGDATQQNCQQCICNELGVDPLGGYCDRVTGQCPCLPNVVGQRCDGCAVNHWNLASGQGCQACDCDPEGSLSAQCYEYDGRCQCKPGRGGRDCSQCEDLHYGDPRVQCYPCECNRQGAATMQCDRRTGECECLPGIDGFLCDRCARGTTGQLPYCKPCGECFDSWDRIIRDLSVRTREMVDMIDTTKSKGVGGVFEREFQHMESHLREIRLIIDNSSVIGVDVNELEQMLDQISKNLTVNEKSLDVIDNELQNTTRRVQSGNNRIAGLKIRVEDLKKLAQELRDNATKVLIENVEGAYNITVEAQRKSEDASRKVDRTEYVIRQSEQIRQTVDSRLASRQDDFERRLQENEGELNELDIQVSGLSGRISEINEMVCDGAGDPCDALCGGGGCGRCGGVSCDDGAVTKADNALDLARKASDLLEAKEADASSLLTQVEVVKREAESAKMESQMAYEKALQAKNQSENARSMLEDLLNRIGDFLTQGGATPDEIRQVAEEVLSMSISLTPDKIQELAVRINITIQGLQNISTILEDTRDDVRLATSLKERADRASEEAGNILGIAENVLEALDGAKVAQDDAELAINNANKDIEDADIYLTQIESETSAALAKSNQTLTTVTILKLMLAALKKKFTENEIKIQRAELEATEAADLASVAEQAAEDLDSKYTDVSDQLSIKYEMTSQARAKAEKLQERANEIAASTTQKYNQLIDMQEDYSNNEKHLIDLSEEIEKLNRRMVTYLDFIQDRSANYRNCIPE